MASLYEQYLGNNRDYLYNTVGIDTGATPHLTVVKGIITGAT